MSALEAGDRVAVITEDHSITVEMTEHAAQALLTELTAALSHPRDGLIRVVISTPELVVTQEVL